MKKLIYHLGHLFIISAFFRVIPIIAGIFYGESVLSFTFTATLSLILGVAGLEMGKPKPGEKNPELTLSDGLVLVALSFILLPLIGAISFYPTLGGFLSAYFESVSGFTTTGLTLYSNLDALPKSLVLWRALTQWMGGVGIVMVFLFIFSRLQHHDYTKSSDRDQVSKSNINLYQSQGFDAKLQGNLKNSVTNIMAIYIGYTIVGIVLLHATGMPLLESIGMASSAFSTGGFSMKDGFNYNSLQMIILSFLMILGAISFINHNTLLQGKWKEFAKAFEKNVLLLLILGATLITLSVGGNPGVVAFEMISAFTTTGYSVSEISLLPPLFIFMIMLGMLMGGNLASTSGGIKTFRVYYMFRTIPWSIKKLMSPRAAVLPLSIDNKEVNEGKLVNIGVFMFSYILILILGTIVFMMFGHSFLNSSFQMFSALGTVGLQTMDLNALNGILKSILILSMLLGRLEIFPVLILFRQLLKRK